MANRFLQQFRYSFEKSIVDVYFKVTIGATGAPTLDAANSKGVKSIARNSAGKYTVTLQDTYIKLLDFDVTELLASGIPSSPNVCLVSQAVTNSAAPTVVFTMSTGGVATDPDNGGVLYGRITVSNSSAF